MRICADTGKRSTLERMYGSREQDRSPMNTQQRHSGYESGMGFNKPVKPLYRRSRSVDALDSPESPPKPMSRSPSMGSDLSEIPGKHSKKGRHSSVSPGKEKRKPRLKRIGSAIIHAINPALAVSRTGLKNSAISSKKKTPKKSRRSSTGSSESSEERDLIDLV